MSSQTTVSLPEHLRSALDPLPDILPSNLKEQLSPFLSESATEIPHSLLLEIAKWARTEAAGMRLRARSLDPAHYSMISLLAGTVTSPSSKLPSYVPPEDAAAVSKRAAGERRAIAAIANAVLSIGGAGYAAWWASSHSGWREEWRVLFALLVALVLAISECILYLIWDSRRDGSRRRRVLRRKSLANKKDFDKDEDSKGADLNGESFDGLRKRKTRTTDE